MNTFHNKGRMTYSNWHCPNEGRLSYLKCFVSKRERSHQPRCSKRDLMIATVFVPADSVSLKPALHHKIESQLLLMNTFHNKGRMTYSS